VVALPELERKRQELVRRRATLLAHLRQLGGIHGCSQTVRAGLATATFAQRRLPTALRQ
jgi:hypothetical protein